jgi:hypothetical protein
MTNDWTFNGEIFTSDKIGKYEGFVYEIKDLETGELYVGRKYFFEIRKVKGKSKRQRTESNWKDYWSSSKILQERVEKKGKDKFERKILSLHLTRGDTNMCEIKEQFLRNVLESKLYLNETIGKYNKSSERIVKARILSEDSLL